MVDFSSPTCLSFMNRWLCRELRGNKCGVFQVLNCAKWSLNCAKNRSNCAKNRLHSYDFVLFLTLTIRVSKKTLRAWKNLFLITRNRKSILIRKHYVNWIFSSLFTSQLYLYFMPVCHNFFWPRPLVFQYLYYYPRESLLKKQWVLMI